MSGSPLPPQSGSDPEAFHAVMRAVFGGVVPYVQLLGITVEDYEDRTLLMRLPYDGSLVGDPDSGVLHGGAVTTLIDSACGLGVIAALEKPRPVRSLRRFMSEGRGRSPHGNARAPGMWNGGESTRGPASSEMSVVHGPPCGQTNT